MSILVLINSCASGAQRDETNVSRLDWFREARFGLFIHWGLYSVPAGEWEGHTNYAETIQLHTKMPSQDYAKYATQFNPVKFDARDWVRVATNAGTKYIVITAKHHDGFCMWDTAFTDYNIVQATPYKQDPMKELAKACREAGIKLCFFYSLPDWHHPEMPAKYNQRGFHGAPNPNADMAKYDQYMRDQVKELLTHYGPVGTLWFDGGGSYAGVKRSEVIEADQMVKMIHELQPDCLINNRLGVGSDFATAENSSPVVKKDRLVEKCMTLNDHWGYNQYDQHWKPAKTVIQDLANLASMGDNLLLNVGATAEGLFPQAEVDILGRVGGWMRTNGVSITATAANPWPTNETWGCVTAGKDCIYVHVFTRPESGVIRLAGLKTEPQSATFLALPKDTAAVPVHREGVDILLDLPKALPDSTDSVIALHFGQAPELEVAGGGG